MTLIAPLPPIHPAANFLPMLDGAELQALSDDIRANGQREPCVMFRGQLLDGRNRWLACDRAGVTPLSREFGSRPSDGSDPVGAVISWNLHRRHLSESQRAMVAARARALFESEARERMALGGKATGGDEEARANLRNAGPVHTTQRAAKLLHVSPRSVTSASVVLSSKMPELSRAVDRGHVAVSAAADVVKGGSKAIESVREALATGDEKKIKQAVKQAARDVRKEDGKPRRTGDAYMSAGGFVRPLLPLIAPGSTILEPCAGAGDLVGPLCEAGHTLMTADIDPAAAVDHHLDMTRAESWAQLPPADWVVSNLPFSRALAILRHAVEHARVGVAVILRLTFLEPTTEGPDARADWLAAHPLTKQIVLPRYSFTGDGKVDSVTCAWMIWERGKAPAIFIPRPDDDGMPGDVTYLVEERYVADMVRRSMSDGDAPAPLVCRTPTQAECEALAAECPEFVTRGPLPGVPVSMCPLADAGPLPVHIDDPALIRSILAAESSDLRGEGRILPPVAITGRLYTTQGLEMDGDRCVRADLWRLTDTRNWTGKIYAPAKLRALWDAGTIERGDLSGLYVKCGSKAYVLDGERRAFTWEGQPEAPQPPKKRGRKS